MRACRHTHTHTQSSSVPPILPVLGLVDMILQCKKSGNYRTSAVKLVFCGKLMNHLLPMTGKKNTCLCPYVMNFYEVKFAVYIKKKHFKLPQM